MASRQRRQSSECSSRQEEDLYTSQQSLVLQFLCHVFLDDKVAKLLPILLLKYQKKELITRAEMLQIVDHDYHEHFPLMFKAVCECMCLGFGIDVREIDSSGHTYVLLPILGLTYNRILSDDYKSISKIDLLIVTLTIIFLKGNCASEEDIREFLRTREMLPQKDHFVIEEPWKFITEDLVQEGYLEYRQVPNSDPACYEFLWGPRAKAETSKMKVLEHLAKVNKRDPKSYTRLYEEALREESEAAQS
ncbi:melanoma-associated antigen 10 [Fukomys damarensis]|uniref:melanoma-associated antigen 10 n=1 Tax=Fukomys damarensis TaxID=885580 RepID=UPI00053F389D|nr:melanoma-associated antigen 10 [Fukomys damarensis]XP_019060083.1 melanoma-associated antigen 10 [Fukomys damarensis]XP_019060084.1 melanoma-associated antigen 10 [Fukomys damarensis]XP_019060085.1 melanoma-associated antigen 10 [Fukomys damarensis]XP_019060086.1 melanoma-associated antigen 10 [Fukomys damarensis]